MREHDRAGEADGRARRPAGQAEHRRLDQELAADHPGRGPSALRSPISRIRSVTETSMMFMTPMPPTSSEMRGDAAEQDRSASWSTDVAVVSSDCWLVMVKSASVGVVIPCRASSSALASW